MIAALLLATMLAQTEEVVVFVQSGCQPCHAMSAQAEEVVVFVQSGCQPCHAMQADVKNGDSQLRVRYINCDTAMPIGVTGFPAVYDPKSKRMHIGRMTLPQLKTWKGAGQ